MFFILAMTLSLLVISSTSMANTTTMQKNELTMEQLKIETQRGVQLDGVLFSSRPKKEAVLIIITGIHGNFYSNPFYYNIGNTLAEAAIDFIYAQSNDAFNTIPTTNVRTHQPETIGSWNERFVLTDEDILAYLDYAEQAGYTDIILGGHSLGANKVIYYLSRHHDPRVKHFFLLSPANLEHMTSHTTPEQRQYIRQLYEQGKGNEQAPFLVMDWLNCTVATAYDWLCENILNNVHTATDADFSQVANLTHTGAMLIGTNDGFTDGNPTEFLQNINNHTPTATQNQLIFIEQTGHTYRQKEQEVADKILQQIQKWIGKNYE